MDIILAPPFSVALKSCSSYEQDQVNQTVLTCLESSNLLGQNALLTRGSDVLVKPNLLRSHNLTCTSPQVITALCICLQEHGIKVKIADSPGFGSVKSVAQSIGLDQALRPLNLKVQSFDEAKSIHIGHGKTWCIARLALESDYIVSVPRLKAHGQMGLTISIKNLFGCICGLHKAMAHAIQGRCVQEFCQSILTLFDALPPTAALVDGITAMHITGPSGGKAFELGLIGASPSAMALDTAMYQLLSASENLTPLWQSAKQKPYEAAFTENIHYTLQNITEFNTNDFILPHRLNDPSFLPHRLLISLCKRIISRF